MTRSYPSLPSTPAPSPPRCSDMDVKQEDAETHDYVEVDPTGRYGRYNEILGMGASKIVYKAFDEYEGIEVAWNQVKIHDLLQRPEDLERLYSEIHLLKTLKHKNIMKFCTSWVDAPGRNINFVTELFTSGTLRQYRQQHKKVNMRAVKHWCRQILRGLLYLHSHDPPIIHRDLKCDNIFINGNQGVVKIGDLGLAAILQKSHYTHCVGTPEFMAPEVFEEEYNELIDIYSFGMCVLEMVTFEYPYSECSHPVQIYKKVMSGTKPAAFHKIEDPELKEFVEKCLASASERPSAVELLKDPFLRAADPDSRYLEGGIRSFITNEFADYNADMSHGMRKPSHGLIHGNGSSLSNNYADYQLHQARSENEWNSSFRDFEMKGIHLNNNEEDHFHSLDIYPEMKGIHLFDEYENEPFHYVDITIKGMRREDGSLFFRLRIIDAEGHVRNIHFPFDIEEDTALTVATEMVGELDITDHDVTRIAEMIDAEVSSLMPELSPGLGSNALDLPATSFCNNHAFNDSSYDSLLEYLSVHAPGSGNLQSSHCSGHEYTAVHGRFEETTYHVEESEQCVTEGAPPLSTSQSEFGSQGSGVSHSDGEGNQLTVTTKSEKETCAASQTGTREHAGQLKSGSLNRSDDSKRTHNELRCLMARDRQLSRRSSNPPPDLYNMKSSVDNGDTDSSADIPSQGSSDKSKKSLHIGKRFSFFFPSRRNLVSSNKSFADTDTENSKNSTSNSVAQRARNSPARNMENIITSKNFYSGFRLQGALL